MATINIQELRQLIAGVPLKEMELDAKHYAVLSVHGEVLADCPSIHYARYFSQVSPKVLGEILDRLEAAEKTSPPQEKYLVAMTLDEGGDTVYYSGLACGDSDNDAFYDWDTNPAFGQVFTDRAQAIKHMEVFQKTTNLIGKLSIYDYKPS